MFIVRYSNVPTPRSARLAAPALDLSSLARVYCTHARFRQITPFCSSLLCNDFCTNFARPKASTGAEWRVAMMVETTDSLGKGETTRRFPFFGSSATYAAADGVDRWVTPPSSGRTIHRIVHARAVRPASRFVRPNQNHPRFSARGTALARDCLGAGFFSTNVRGRKRRQNIK